MSVVYIGQEPRRRARTGHPHRKTTPRKTSERCSDPGVHRTRGHNKEASQRNSIQSQGVQGKISQTRVTRDESKVSVGGLLALDQVLGISWSC
jgi:hypothetical protein